MKRSLVLYTAVLVILLAFRAGPASATQTPVTADNFEVMLVVDISGSMQPAMDLTKQAAIGFLGQISPNIRVGLESFGRQITVLSQPTTDRALLTQQINALVADGDTPLYDAMITAVGSFTPAGEHRALVLLSDGRDSSSANTLEAAVAAVAGLHVEAISLTTAGTDVAALQSLGTVSAAEDPAGLALAFTRVADLLTKVVDPPATTTPTVPETTAAPATVAATAAPATVATTPATTVYSRPPAPASALTTTSSSRSSSLLLGAVGIFVGLFALALLAFPRKKVSKKRLGIQQPKSVSDMGKRTITAFDDMLDRRGKRGALSDALIAADISMQPGEFVAMVLAVMVAVGIVGLLIVGPVLAVVLAILVPAVARFVVGWKKTRRQTAFAEQLPEVLQLVTTALRSGYGVLQALDSVAEEADEPAKSEFAHVLVEARLGRDLSDAMRALSQRMDNTDLDWVVSAIDINRDTGGNLSEILGKVGETVRERQRMRRQVQTFTAEGRLSARILTALPFLLALLQWRTNPEGFNAFFRGLGLVLLIASGLLILTGWFWIKRVVTIKL